MVIEFEVFKLSIQRNPKKQINLLRPVGKRRVWKVKRNYSMVYSLQHIICIHIRVVKGIAYEIKPGESETTVVIKVLKGEVLLHGVYTYHICSCIAQILMEQIFDKININICTYTYVYNILVINFVVNFYCHA